MGFWLLVLTSFGTARADAPFHCDEPSTNDELVRSMDRVTRAFASLDTNAFRAGMNDLDTLLLCLGEVPQPGVVARMHRLQGINLYIASDNEGASRAFAASRALDSSARLDAGLFPEGHEIWSLFDTVDLGTVDQVQVPQPVTGFVLLDGKPATQQYFGLPALFAWAESPRGPVWLSEYLKDGEALPDYPLAVTPESQSTSSRPPRAQRDKKGVDAKVFALASVGAFAVAGGLYGLASMSRSELQSPPTSWTNDDLTAAQTRTNGLVVGSMVFGGAGLVLGGVAIGGSW